MVTQKLLHQVNASFLKYNVRNSAASRSVIRVANTYAWIENIKFSVSECLPENVIGFSCLIVDKTVVVVVTGYYYEVLVACEGPASATGYGSII